MFRAFAPQRSIELIAIEREGPFDLLIRLGFSDEFISIAVEHGIVNGRSAGFLRAIDGDVASEGVALRFEIEQEGCGFGFW